MPANPVGLVVHLGLKDTEPTPWGGEVELSQGRVISMSVRRGGANAHVDGTRFTARSVRQQQAVNGPVLRLDLDAPANTTVTLKTRQGNASFKLADLRPGPRTPYLDGRVTVEREEGAVRLTGRETEDGYPALAKGADGTIWLAYVEYQPNPPIVMDRVKVGGFEELAPKGNGDQILLVRFDGRTWYPPLEVTNPGLDVWRPTVTVDGRGVVWVAWAQQVYGDWEVFHRRYTPGANGSPGRWSEVTRVTNHPGTDFNVVAATDSTGSVWLAWQSWRNDNFDVVLAAQVDGHPWHEPRVLSNSKANDWNPSITADGTGNVYVAYDTYDRGNYDVLLTIVNKESRTIPVATSAKFEARPHIAGDAQGRVWIAYEEGDEQWGKDYAHAGNVTNVGLEKNPGFALYVNRTVRVKCLADGKLLEPAEDLEKTFAASPLRRNKSLPRLAVDASGGVWLLVRHHLVPGAAGEAWGSFAVRYDGSRWSSVLPLADSANLMDVRPALTPLGPGVLAVYSGDDRIRTQNRDQDDLFAAVLQPGDRAAPGTRAAVAPELVAVSPSAAARLPAVHPHEAEDIGRMRTGRLEVNGKKLHFLRGEFHRHTEYGSHNDGDGLLEDAWRYALDAADLDWIGVGDHDNGFGVDYYWWTFQKVTDLFQNPPRFVAVHTYERSVVYPNGHRDVIMPHRGIRPLPRHERPVADGTPEQGSDDTKMLYAYLKHFGGICASHTSATNMGTDWRDNDPDVEPVVEVYQGHRHNYEQPGAPRSPTQQTQIGGFRPKGFINLALEKGYRLGFESSSDHISTHISYGMVLTDDVSRQGIIDAFKKRHSYAATDNILLDVRCDGHLMGDAFELNRRPTLDIRIIGTAAVARVHLLRNNRYVYTGTPNTNEATLRCVDNDAPAGKANFYYVRVEQVDGNLAWSSPLWVTVKP
jgi:hypothetical protein